MKSHLSLEERNSLIQAARDVAKTAYAPYSQFRIGAAVLGERAIHVGANVENASYGLSLCAERVALSTAVAQGDRKIQAIAIASTDAIDDRGIRKLLPCGVCRQWLIELARDAEIIIVGPDHTETFTVNQLMPMPFEVGIPLSDTSN